jgi:hypothetical protein
LDYDSIFEFPSAFQGFLSFRMEVWYFNIVSGCDHPPQKTRNFVYSNSIYAPLHCLHSQYNVISDNYRIIWNRKPPFIGEAQL